MNKKKFIKEYYIQKLATTEKYNTFLKIITINLSAAISGNILQK